MIAKTNKELLDEIKNKWVDVYPDDKLLNVRIHHLNNKIGNQHKFLKDTKYPKNGCTVVVFQTEKNTYITGSVCSPLDQFCRAIGVSVALKDLKGDPAELVNITEIVTPEYFDILVNRVDNQKSIAATKILAYLLRTGRRPDQNPTQEILDGYKRGLKLYAAGIKKAVERDETATYKYQVGHIRLTQRGKLVTNPVGSSQGPLLEKGGITFVISVISDTTSDKRHAILSYSRCSEKDNFNKTIGTFFAFKAQTKQRTSFDLSVQPSDTDVTLYAKAIDLLSELCGQPIITKG